MIVDDDTANRNQKDYCLAYKLTVANGDGRTLIFKINANTGTIVGYDTKMYGYNYQDAFVVTDLPGQYTTTYNTYRKLLSSTSGGNNRFFSDATTSEEMALMEYRRVFFHMGHGTAYLIGSEWHSVIVTPGINCYIAPSDILSKSLGMMQLAFLGPCYSFGGTIPSWPSDIVIDYSIGEAFLDAGAKCVFGWTDAVTMSQDWLFAECFFDRAVNGYDFQSCYDYAKSKIWSSERSIAKIDGDTSLSLPEDDTGADGYPGTYLGAGSDTTFTINDEGLWGIGIDYDWYRFLVSVTRHVEIFVRPVDSSLDVTFKVYDVYMNLQYTKNSGGYGSTEWVSFTGFGTYYLQIYAGGTTHGGAYNLEIKIQIIS
ncbi:MAG: hypothetical protein P1Q69_03610 [Candidatus Thorarchaeota archaeon]|nr:hypothetical protein [Candidatus Thorarchaeota archaeon]